MSSVLLSQGGYGCVYYPSIDCLGKQNEKYVSKVQANDETAQWEVMMGEKIKTIPNFKQFFIPVVDNCEIESTILEKDKVDLSQCQPIKKHNELLVLKLPYVEYYSGHEYLKIKNPNTIFSSLMNHYLHILKSISLLLNKDLVHYDLKSDNLLRDKNSDNIYMIDFGLTLDMSLFHKDKLKDYFYVFAPDYHVYSYDIHILCYFASSQHSMDEKITKAHIESITNQTINAHIFNSFFSAEFMKNYHKKCLVYGYSLVGKTKGEIIQMMTTKDYYKTWDNYSLSVMIFRQIFFYFRDKIGPDNVYGYLLHILLVNLSPNPKDRFSIQETINYVKKALKTGKGNYSNVHIDDLFYSTEPGPSKIKSHT